MSFLTNRDRRVLQEVGHLKAAPLSHLLGFFPTSSAGYVRLGVLARRGLVHRFSAKGARWVSLSPSGAAAVGGTVLRGRSRIAERRAALANVHHLLTSCGYARVPRPPSAPRSLVYYERMGEILGVAITLRLRRRGHLQALTHPVIFSPASRVVRRIIVFVPGTTSRRLPAVPESWQSRIVLMSLPNSMTVGIMKRQLLEYLRCHSTPVRRSQMTGPSPARTMRG